MQMTQQQLTNLMAEIYSINDPPWIEVQSELQKGGAECPIWILVAEERLIRPAFDILLKVTEPYRDAAYHTAFSFTIDEDAGEFIKHWDHIEDKELRSGALLFPLASEWSPVTKDDLSVYRRVREECRRDK
jgi:hypothetical protein